LIRRTFDPAFLNSVINHPEVRPWVGGEGALDVTETINNPSNFALVTDGGGFILIQHEPGIYEVHSQFLPEGRRETRRAMRSGFDYMFTRTDCQRVITQVPDNNPAAAALAKAAGFREMFRRDDTPRGPSSFMGLTAEEWAQGNRSLEVDGEEFHRLLEEAKKKSGSELPVHPHDPAHERAVGAAMRMIRAGNAEKGVEFYNRWARFAGYALIFAVSLQPVVIDVVDAVVGLGPEGMEVLLCR
jgi:hypothetical protein